jgi:transposase InsO family protein
MRSRSSVSPTGSVHAYFDQRGVYRAYAASLDQATWRYWRDAPAPDFSQRFAGTFSDDGNTITGGAPMSSYYRVWRTRSQLELAVVEHIGWYKSARLYESLGDIPPADYEQRVPRQATTLAGTSP